MSFALNARALQKTKAGTCHSLPLGNEYSMIFSLQHRPTAIYCLHGESGSNGKASFLDVHVTRMGRDVSCQVLEICWQHRDEC